MKNVFVSLVIAASSLLLAPGCERDSEVGRTVDCVKICSKYSECMKEIDVPACAAECEDKADADSRYQSSAATCTECVADKACKEVEPCWASCPSMPAVQR